MEVLVNSFIRTTWARAVLTVSGVILANGTSALAAPLGNGGRDSCQLCVWYIAESFTLDRDHCTAGWRDALSACATECRKTSAESTRALRSMWWECLDLNLQEQGPDSLDPFELPPLKSEKTAEDAKS